MRCLKCATECFEERIVNVPQVVRGEDFAVSTKAMVCTKCGWFTMTNAQADKLAVQAADEYRRRHGLLTTTEIVAARKCKEMSQREFAEFLGVGEASVKRWETGSIQDRVYDDVIRRKCSLTFSQCDWDCGRANSEIRFTAFHITKSGTGNAAKMKRFSSIPLIHSASGRFVFNFGAPAQKQPKQGNLLLSDPLLTITA